MPSSAATLPVAAGVMPLQILGGPVWWYFFGVYALAFVLSAYCFVDSLRPQRRERFAEIPEPGWLYTAVHGVYLVCVLAVWIPGVPRVLAAVPVGLMVFALGFGFAYLLRVVFPKPVAGEPDAQDEPSEGEPAGDAVTESAGDAGDELSGELDD